MLRRLNVSTKVRAVLAVPMVVLIVAGAYITWSAVLDLRYARANSAVLQVLVDTGPLNSALRAEVSVSESDLTSAAKLQATRAATDKAVAELQSAGAKVDTGQLTPGSRSAFADMLRSLSDTLPRARAQVDGHTGLASTFESIFTAQSSFVATYSNETTDRVLATQVAAHSEILAYTADLENEHQAGLDLMSAPGAVAATAKYVTARAQTDQSSKVAASAVEDLGLSGDPLRGFDSLAAKMRSDLANGDPALVRGVNSDAWTAAVAQQFKSTSSVDAAVLTKANLTASGAARDALVRLGVTLGVIIFAGVSSWLLASFVARSIVRPLRRLTETAAQVREQLPRLVEQVAVPGEGPDIELPRIAVESDDEIGRLAGAFNDVNATTIQVAQEQAALRGSIAEMFVNVARRDQVLLNRQLAFVDSLERSEEDPTVLANLFHLDHLATRMRRNAESLLVLAGIDSGRRLRESMPLSDVIRTASSEIEQYDRVELDLTVDPSMLGFNALPAAHMLAELLENASVFSEPDTPVEVATGMSGQFVTVSVLDHGIGLTDDELTAVNDKLRAASPGDALGAQRLGLFVVARLAHRLGAEVSIHHAPGGPGAETIVRFPIALFAGLDSEQPPVPRPALSPEVEALVEAQEVPELRPVDLSALTDGETDLGLPRRRLGAVPDDLDSGAFVLPTAVTSVDLPTDLTGTADGWAPMIVSSETTGLPSRRREAEVDAPEVPLLDLTPIKPVDPEDRKGLFTGFRGWSRQQDEAGTDAVETSGPSFPPDAVTAVPEQTGEPEAGQEPAAASATPVVPRPRTRTRRGAHAAPSSEPESDVPFGYTSDEVSSWRTGAIPVVSTTDENSDWPSPTWDSAAWQPAGLFVHPEGEAGPMIPAFDPIALEPDDDEQPYAPVALEPADGVAPAEGWAVAGASEPAWTAPDEPWAAAVTQDEPVWQPVVDLSPNPLGSAARAPEPVDAGVADVDEPVWQPVVDLSPNPLGSGVRAPETFDAAPADVEPAMWQPTLPADGAPFGSVTFDQDEPVWQPMIDLSGGQVEPDGAEQETTDWAGPAWPSTSEGAASVSPAAPAFTAPPGPAFTAPPAPAFAAPPVAEPAQAFTPVVDPTPASPAWPSVSAGAAASVEAPIADAGRKRRFGLFGRKGKPEVGAPQSGPEPIAAAPAPGLPLWSPTEEPAAAVPAPAEPTWSAPTWSAAAEPEPHVAPVTQTWAPPPSPPAAADPIVASPSPRPAPAEVRAWGAFDGATRSPAGRVGTLDDDVAAMLALRSDIEEQALSELSQLSAYRPSMGGSAERLTRRVPTAVPVTSPAAGDHPIRRDADELRSRLASFQSGTTRGRRAPVEPEGHA